jgi:hypothetical protein
MIVAELLWCSNSIFISLFVLSLLDPQGSAADVAMCAMLEIERNSHLKELGWRLLLQVCPQLVEKKMYRS